MTNSPLGQYAPLTAAACAIGIVGSFLAATLFAGVLNIPADTVGTLKDVALLALGAVFGSAVAVNGTKSSITALHKRFDAAGIPAAADTPPSAS